MKTFLYKTAKIFFIFLLFNTVLFFFSRINYYEGYKKYPDKNFKTFIFSDSHGIPIGTLSEKYNVFNFSAKSDSYFDMKRKILYLLANGFNIDTVFITVDDYTLSPYREKVNNFDKSSIYSLPFEYENYYTYIKGKYLNYYLPIFQPKVTALFKSYLKAKLKDIYQPNNTSLKMELWCDYSEDERALKAEKRIKSQFPIKNKSKKLENTLLEIIHLCQLNEIELIGIKFPVSSSYVDVLKSKSYGADKIFTTNGLRVEDYKEIFLFYPAYFSDQDHLNSRGGEIFAARLLAN